MSGKSPFAELLAVMARLRADDGCPWDREQDHRTLKPYLLEEAYEALAAIDAGADGELCKELGDVLLQVVFHAQIASEEGRFTIADVCRAIVDKLVRRHPHVFADVEVDGSQQVVDNWERIKQAERREQARPASRLEGVPASLPALLRAQRIQSKASRAGFDWDRIDGTLEKVEEEVAELRQAIAEDDAGGRDEEFGDLLFALVNCGRFLELCPEDALRRAVDKFERRFRALATAFAERGEALEETTLEEMDRVWDQVKREAAAVAAELRAMFDGAKREVF